MNNMKKINIDCFIYEVPKLVKAINKALLKKQ